MPPGKERRRTWLGRKRPRHYLRAWTPEPREGKQEWKRRIRRARIFGSAAAQNLFGQVALLRVFCACGDVSQLMSGGGSSGLTNDKLGLDGDLGHVFTAALDEIDDRLRGDLPHLHEWLPDSGKSWIGVGGPGNVIEANNGNVFGNAQACFVERPDRADGRDVVVSKKRSERMLPGQELLGEGISNAGSGIETLELDGQLGTNANAELLRYLADRVPTHAGIRTHGLASNEGDFLVTEIAKMFEGQVRGARVVQDDVGQAFDAAMARDGDGRESKLFAERCVRGDEPLDASRQKHLRVGLQEFRIVTVDHGEEEIIVLAQIFFDSANHHRAVGVANFFGDHANGVGTFQAQSASKKVGAVIERLGGFNDAIFCVLGKGARGGRVVQGG